MGSSSYKNGDCGGSHGVSEEWIRTNRLGRFSGKMAGARISGKSTGIHAKKEKGGGRRHGMGSSSYEHGDGGC